MPADPPPAPHRPQTAVPTARPTVAAALFLVMFLISGTIAVYSGYLLYRGEETDPIFTALPGTCDWVVVVDQPGEVAAAWRPLTQKPHVSGRLKALAVAQAQAWQRIEAVAGLGHDSPWGLCGHAGGVVAAVPDAGGGLKAGQLLVEALSQAAPQLLPAEGTAGQALAIDAQGSQWQADTGGRVLRQADGRARVRLQTDGKLLTVTWAAMQGPDAVDLSVQAATQARSAPLQKHTPFREGTERVGGGQLHLWLAEKTWREQVLPALAQDGAWRDGLGKAAWAAAVLRTETGHARLHGHLGPTQPFVAFLKEWLDPAQALDASRFLPEGDGSTAVLRRAPGLLARAEAWPWPWLHSFAAKGQVTARQTGKWLTGQVIARQHAAAYHLTATGQAAPELAAAVAAHGDEARLAAEFLVLGDQPAAVAALAGELAAPKDPRLDGDRKRLGQDTQGYALGTGTLPGPDAWGLAGPAQVEWLWIDTGLIAEVDVR